MTKPQSDIAAVRERLNAVDGIEHAFIDAEAKRVCLVLRADIDAHEVEQAALAAVGDELDVQIAYKPERRDRQRVRFMGIQRETQRDQQIAFTVGLEWAGTEYTGSAAGEKGDAVELRTAAAASLTAIAALVPHDVKVRLAGVKMVRAFDAELVVVSLYRPDDQPHNLVGAVVAGDDPRRAAATAVLSALNRLLGNYLALP